ncbi:MAG: cell division protein ZapA [Xanthomonadales bacterium]|nr:MAG: cell division protein ZapA [Dokdonella sp.]MBC6942431.1 cell division protein ZapA [Xanthomonadales bacterium]MCC6595725.1 cell division protein ZapA [Rhodanobacteraceae bacterium]MDL1869721.1 cell division protein ZapA [Gammaproteobacteria bacterium PRO6]
MSAGEPVKVVILDREFHVACTDAERPGLMAAARHLDERMREMRNNARTAGVDRIAILAALNICHELLETQARMSSSEQALAEKLHALNLKLEGAFVPSLQ